MINNTPVVFRYIQSLWKILLFIPLLTWTEVVFIFAVLRLLKHLELTFSDFLIQTIEMGFFQSTASSVKNMFI